MLTAEDRINFAEQMLNYGLTGFKFAERPEDAMSATQLRQAAVDNNDDAFNHGIQFGAVTPEHSALIKKIIRAKYGIQGGKRRKRTRRRWRKPRRKTKRRREATKRKGNFRAGEIGKRTNC